MRYEILKFLTNGYDYKDLGLFLKEKYPQTNLREFFYILNEMYSGPQFRENNVIDIEGNDWKYLGKEIVELENFGKAEVIMKNRPGYDKKNVLYEGIGDLSNSKILARITDLGRKELQAFELNESVKETNKSVKSTNKVTILIAVIATIFSLTSLLIAITKTKSIEVKQLQETNRILQKQNSTLDSFLQKTNLNLRVDSLKK